VARTPRRLGRRRATAAVTALFGASLGALASGCRPVQPATPTSAVGPGLALAGAGDGSLFKADRGLFRSADGGATWTGLPVPPALRPSLLSRVATAGDEGGLVAAGPGAGVLRSDDGGQTWRAVGGGLPSQQVVALAAHTSRPETIFVSLRAREKEASAVFRTENGGGRWQKMDDGPPAPVGALVHSPLEGSMNTGWLYAGTPEGPYLSMDCF
jgi:photosystem II stability/assembly factor-like uncharacterized protein